jgi:hypothetical protein
MPKMTRIAAGKSTSAAHRKSSGRLDCKHKSADTKRKNFANHRRAVEYYRWLLGDHKQALDAWRANMPDPTVHPVWFALLTPYLERWEALERAVDRGPNGLAALEDQRPHLGEEIWELGELIAPVRRRADGFSAYRMSQASFTAEETDKMLADANKRKQGRIRHSARIIAALEMKILKRKTPTQIAQVFCDCNLAGRDMKEHDYDCGERIRKQMERLEKILKRYQ